MKIHAGFLMIVAIVVGVSCRSLQPEARPVPPPAVTVADARAEPKKAPPPDGRRVFSMRDLFPDQMPPEKAASGQAAQPDPHTPGVSSVETVEAPLIGTRPLTVYRFSDEQIDRMRRTPLDAVRFVEYLERLWPVERLAEYCVAKNLWPPMHQNLVPMNRVFAGDIHRGRRHGFDKVHVYVTQDDGVEDGRKTTYVESAGRQWHRWTYSLNIARGTNRWTIIERLPNSLMDARPPGK